MKVLPRCPGHQITCTLSRQMGRKQVSNREGQLPKWVDNRSKGTAMMKREDYPILLSIQQAARKIGKSEKTIRRWMKDGKLKAANRGGGYLMKREDLAALDKRVTKEWQEGSELAHIRLQVSIMEGQVEYLHALVDEQQGEIEDLQHQVN